MLPGYELSVASTGGLSSSVNKGTLAVYDIQSMNTWQPPADGRHRFNLRDSRQCRSNSRITEIVEAQI